MCIRDSHYSKNVTLFADAGNLFNSKQQLYLGDDPRYLANLRDHGVRIQAGVNGSF